MKVGDLVRHKQLGFMGLLVAHLGGSRWLVFRHGIRVRWWVEDMEIINASR
tara:strand:+ start:1726 stop:1878 length:153 start_codon:yes stop_codon:yes gene_type:complete